jgi:hypothetical protein
MKILSVGLFTLCCIRDEVRHLRVPGHPPPPSAPPSAPVKCRVVARTNKTANRFKVGW